MRKLIPLLTCFALAACGGGTSPSDPEVVLHSATVNTLAGNGTTGLINGTGLTAQFTQPWGVALDVDGNVYVGDEKNNAIRKITPAGLVSTLAGNGTAGAANGAGTGASFDLPGSVAVDTLGNLYVADIANRSIREVTSSGVVSTLAAGLSGLPNGVAVDGGGNVYVASSANVILKITSTGVVSTLAGNGTPGYAEGTGAGAIFNGPYGITIDSFGNLFVADNGNSRIRKITPSGVVTTFAGSGISRSVDGVGTAASFWHPLAIAVDRSDNLFVADNGPSTIRKITPGGVVSTLTTSLNGLVYGIAVDNVGIIYVADTQKNVILKITP